MVEPLGFFMGNLMIRVKIPGGDFRGLKKIAM